MQRNCVNFVILCAANKIKFTLIIHAVFMLKTPISNDSAPVDIRFVYLFRDMKKAIEDGPLYFLRCMKFTCMKN